MKAKILKFFYILFLVILVALVYTIVSIPQIKKHGSDTHFLMTERPSFPIYINAIFIHHDLKNLSFADTLLVNAGIGQANNPFYTIARNGGKILKSTIGTSMVSLPAFFVGNLIAKSTSQDLNGTSLPYLATYFCFGAICLLLGFYFLWISLRRYFSLGVTMVVMTIILCCTSILELVPILGELDFIYLFFLHALLIYMSIKFFERPAVGIGAFTGLLVGLIALIRPIEIGLVLIPLLWKTSYKLHHLKVRLYHIIRNYKSYIAMLATTILTFGIQNLYWLKYSGNAFVFNDQLVGVASDVERLHLLTIGPDRGVFLYYAIIPIMLFGFLFLRGKYLRLRMAILIPVFLMSYASIYYLFWWNAGDNGSDYLIQLFPFLSFPLAALVDFCIARFASGILLCIVLSIICYANAWKLHDHWFGKVLAPSNKSYEYLKAVFGNDSVGVVQIKLLDTKVSFGYEIVGDTILTQRRRPFCLNAKAQYSRRLETNITSQQYYRFSLEAKTLDYEKETWRFAHMIISYYQGRRNIGNDLLRIQRVMIGNEWQEIYLDSKRPDNADRLAVSIWNADSDKEICFKNIKLIAFDGILQASKHLNRGSNK